MVRDHDDSSLALEGQRRVGNSYSKFFFVFAEVITMLLLSMFMFCVILW
jgi:hypothetical protein